MSRGINMHVGVQNYMKYQCTTHTIYLPWYSGTYNFQDVEHLQMRFRAPVAF